MKKTRFILIFALCLTLATPLAWSALTWEYISPTNTEEFIDNEKVEIDVQDGYIYISTPKTTNVKVFSIVGQLITEGKLKPGISRFKMNTRGIYIVKVGERTARVTL